MACWTVNLLFDTALHCLAAPYGSRCARLLFPTVTALQGLPTAVAASIATLWGPTLNGSQMLLRRCAVLCCCRLDAWHPGLQLVSLANKATHLVEKQLRAVHICETHFCCNVAEGFAAGLLCG